MTVLRKFPQRKVQTFLNDYNTLLEMSRELDAELGRASEDIYYNEPLFQDYIGMFNKKYPGLQVVYQKGTERIKFYTFIKDKPLLDIFKECLANIAGLVTVGAEAFDRCSVNNPDQLKAELNLCKTKLFANYTGYEKNTVLLAYNRKLRQVELDRYSGEDVLPLTPEFKVLCFYALNTTGDWTVDLHKASNRFCYRIKSQGHADKDPGFFN